MMASSAEENSICAACGKAGDSLKACGACQMVKYCGRACQLAHRSAHKKDCKRKAAELYDVKLFTQPPPNEDCPVCFLPLPIQDHQSGYGACCGKMICSGCSDEVRRTSSGNLRCPFCRTEAAETYAEFKNWMEKRIEKDDPNACYTMGGHYFNGSHGLPRDVDKGMELYNRAAELGSVSAHAKLGDVYFTGQNGIERDVKKAKHHFEHAAILGCAVARANLGYLEQTFNKDLARAVKHYMISARSGHEPAMQYIKRVFLGGIPLVTKEQYEETLRAWKSSSDEMKSESRDRYDAMYKLGLTG